MIAKITAKIKYLTQKIYNDFIDSFDFANHRCSCSYSGYFIMHGYYWRWLRSSMGTTQLKILRVKCKSCNKTHAILPPYIVPYSQIPLTDIIDILISYENKTTYKFNDNSNITESDVKYIISKYRKYWRERILAIAIGEITEFLDCADLPKQVFRAYNTAFMQIKRCCYCLSY